MGKLNLEKASHSSPLKRTLKALLQVILLVFPHSLSAGKIGPTFPLAGEVVVSGIATTVSNLDSSMSFYTQVLGFRVISQDEIEGENCERHYGVFAAHVRRARLGLGSEEIELIEFISPRGKRYPEESRSNDRWFQHFAIVTSNMGKAYERLRAARVEFASSSPQRLPDWNQAAAGILAFYFKDPDGHPLEILEFPNGIGDARWHVASGQLFLGIDHTAIVVANTSKSLGFYRDLLGLVVAGESENYGTEQEHLNSVFGARLHITTLRPQSGPGVELLEYLTPRDGRPYPRDEQANDLVHRQTLFSIRDVARLAGQMREARTTFVSSEIQSIAGKSIVVRDPDGHAIQISER